MYKLCRLVSSSTNGSSISCSPSGSIRSQYSAKPDWSELVKSVAGGVDLETNTTSNFRRFRSLPMTTWCPYRSSALRAFGISNAGSVSNYNIWSGGFECVRDERITNLERDDIASPRPFIDKRLEDLGHFIHLYMETPLSRLDFVLGL
jgi:hypothetical protein